MPRHGITSTTVKNLAVGPGALYRDFQNPASPGTLIGATTEGNVARVTREWFVPELDGALGELKGARRLVREIPEIQANLVEMTLENLLMALSGAQATPYPAATPTHDLITSTGLVSDGNYQTIALVGDLVGSNQPFVFVVKNALIVDNAEFTFGDRRTTGLRVTFRGHYDPANPNLPPYEIYRPRV